ncbi:MAG TPA: pantoate--beta-alanine ligase [Acidimicrobiales bacterium]|nr:pantoate--beta-alanine ligase [Acidimicrobiales bacterium]
MIELTRISEWRAFANDERAGGRRIGLVPTMGALHGGHASLFRAARESCDVVLATVFVNPRQFGDENDLAHYPRTLDADREIAQHAGVDCLVVPTLEEMWPDYPRCTPTAVSVRGIGEVLEGAGRPGHFDGVASVVTKLFTVTGPCRAFFGEKDFQQLAVVRQLVHDLDFDVDVVGCPIVRDPDGLALSSRNARLSPEGRRRALGLSRALGYVATTSARASTLRSTMRTILDDSGVEVAYADVVDPRTLESAGDGEVGERRALIAGFVDGVRLIDTGPVTVVSN